MRIAVNGADKPDQRTEVVLAAKPAIQLVCSTKRTCPVLNALRADTPFCLEYPPKGLVICLSLSDHPELSTTLTLSNMSRWLTMTRMASFLRLFVDKVSNFHLFILYVALHLLRLGAAYC
jgi:hypothetical protein